MNLYQALPPLLIRVAISLAARARPRGKKETEKEKLFVEIGEMYKDFAARHNRLYTEGRISKGEWITRMRQEVKDLAILSYAAGLGEWPTTQSQWGKTGAHIRKQYSFIARFAENIENMTLAQMNVRAGFYANGARPIFEAGVVESKTTAEFDSKWLPAMPGQGSECKMNCQCYWAMKKVNRKLNGFPFYWVVSWTLREARHCRTCVIRSRKAEEGGWGGTKVFPDGSAEPPFQPINAF